MKTMIIMLAMVTCSVAISVPANALETNFRPPRQTPTQKEVLSKIASKAVEQSNAAKEWVIQYMGNTTLRGRLPNSLKNISNEELFNRFDWEFRRLSIIHNAPLDEEEVNAQKIISDDTILNITLNNGYIQNPCHRLVTGGPEKIQLADSYAYNFFIKRVGMPTTAYSPNWTLSDANECLLYNANNLRKTSLGNFIYGGVTYVLNQKALKDRIFFEAWDAGNTETMYHELNMSYPGFGTIDNWYHLVKPHEELFNLPYPQAWRVPSIIKCCDYSIADLFNRWWVPGTAVPTTGLLYFLFFFFGLS